MLEETRNASLKIINTMESDNKKFLAVMVKIEVDKLPLIKQAIKQADKEIAWIDKEMKRGF